ncbi:MAG TPA: PIG-L family deacetylase [Thermomicrobiaceae bacterium]|nr:PIG-L family deacetylase [Thermomicrobiaceae bacterium]
MSEQPTIMAVYAHPDDEVFSAGGTLAKYARTCRVVLVSATRGELGEIRVPGSATPETLAEVREGELRESARILGIHEVRFLDYRDSGMAGTPGNQDARALVQADRAEAAGRLVALFRELRPRAVLTFEQTGGYGHPDHITVHELTTAAFDAAGADLRAARLFYSGFPRGMMRAFQEEARAAGVDLGGLGELDIERFGLPDDAVDAVIDVRDFIEQKLAAFQAHQTQFGDNEMMRTLPPELGRRLLEQEYYQQARGAPLPGPKPAHDLLAE